MRRAVCVKAKGDKDSPFETKDSVYCSLDASQYAGEQVERSEKAMVRFIRDKAADFQKQGGKENRAIAQALRRLMREIRLGQHLSRPHTPPTEGI